MAGNDLGGGRGDGGSGGTGDDDGQGENADGEFHDFGYPFIFFWAGESPLADTKILFIQGN